MYMSVIQIQTLIFYNFLEQGHFLQHLVGTLTKWEMFNQNFRTVFGKLTILWLSTWI
jgi:hypothetical protein